MKYVVIEYSNKSFKKEDIFLFPELLVHDEFTNDCIKHYERLKFINVKVISAGFCNAEAQCFGESKSLGLKSREEDSNLIFKMQYHLNIM